MEKNTSWWVGGMLLASACAPAEVAVDAPPPSRVYDFDEIVRAQAMLQSSAYAKVSSEADLASAGDAIEIACADLAAPWMQARRTDGSIRHLQVLVASATESLAAVAEFRDLDTLSFVGVAPSADALAPLATMKRVDHLAFAGNGPLDASRASKLADVPGVRCLSVLMPPPNPAGLAALADMPSLEQLQVLANGAQETDLDGLGKIGRLRSLRIWCAASTQFSGRFLRGLPNLHVLMMLGGSSPETIHNLPKGLRHLLLLGHSGSGQEAFDVSPLGRLTKLETLQALIPTDPAQLATAIRQAGVRSTVLNDKTFRQEFVDALGSEPQLRELDLRCTVERLQVAIVRAATIRSLERLRLMAKELPTTASAQALAEHPNLKSLVLQIPRANVDYGHLKLLRKQLPNVEITIE